VSAQRASVSVFDATYLACLQGTYDGIPQILPHAPVAGEELVGLPTEQERVGALVELIDPRHGLAVERRPGPSAALESPAACCWIQPAVSLHHPSTETCVLVVSFMSSSFLVVVLLAMTAPTRGSHRSSVAGVGQHRRWRKI